MKHIGETPHPFNSSRVCCCGDKVLEFSLVGGRVRITKVDLNSIKVGFHPIDLDLTIPNCTTDDLACCAFDNKILLMAGNYWAHKVFAYSLTISEKLSKAPDAPVSEISVRNGIEWPENPHLNFLSPIKGKGETTEYFFFLSFATEAWVCKLVTLAKKPSLVMTKLCNPFSHQLKGSGSKSLPVELSMRSQPLPANRFPGLFVPMLEPNQGNYLMYYEVYFANKAEEAHGHPVLWARELLGPRNGLKVPLEGVATVYLDAWNGKKCNVILGFGGLDQSTEPRADLWMFDLEMEKKRLRYVKPEDEWHPPDFGATLLVRGPEGAKGTKGTYLYIIGGRESRDIHCILVDELRTSGSRKKEDA